MGLFRKHRTEPAAKAMKEPDPSAGSLEDRARAAAAQEAAERSVGARAAAEEQDRQRQSLIATAIREVEHVLAHETQPTDWTACEEFESEVGTCKRAYATIQGVQVRYSVRGPEVLPPEGVWTKLTLSQFGRALESTGGS